MKKNTAEDTFARLKRIPLSLNAVDFSSFEIEGVDRRDYPDFCDAFITFAAFEDGRELSEDEMDQLNEHTDLVYECACGDLY